MLCTMSSLQLHDRQRIFQSMSVALPAVPPPVENAAASERVYTKLTRDIGNVYGDSESALDYGLRSNAMDTYAHLKALPFQVQVSYTTLHGMRAVRVLTQEQSVTRDRAVAESNVKLEVVSAQIAQKSAQLAREGRYKESRLHWVSAAPMLSRSAQTPQQQQVLKNYSKNIASFDRVHSKSTATGRTSRSRGR